MKEGMNNPPLITRWVNDYRIAGPDALRDKCKGQRLEMPKTKDSIDKNEEYLKRLEEENLKLKIENKED